MYLNVKLHPYIFSLVWTGIQYILDFLFVYACLKYLPLQKLPGYTHDLGNFIYIVMITFVVITLKSKFIDWLANKVRARHLGAEDLDVAYSDPKRV